MAASRITLDFLAAQQRTILDEMAVMRTEMAAVRTDIGLIKDDIGVLAAMAQRQDRATKAVLDLVNNLTRQQNRPHDRLRQLEEREEA